MHFCYAASYTMCRSNKYGMNLRKNFLLSVGAGLPGMLHCYSSKQTLQLQHLIMSLKCSITLKKLLLKQEHHLNSYVKTCKAFPYRFGHACTCTPHMF